jgi:hypothetical protein
VPSWYPSETLRTCILASLKEKIRANVAIDGRGCWRWRRSKSIGGYGICYSSGKYTTRYAHRIAYMEFVGPIPSGLCIDHLCRVRDCCNPDHLEAVTLAENLRRGQGHGAETHCPAGHEYNDENTHTDKSNNRHCRVCDKLRKRKRRQKNPEAHNAYMRAYRRRNREAYNAYMREYNQRR